MSYELPYYPMYVKDFLGDTGMLTAEKVGAYILLLNNSWRNPLYDDIEELTSISRLDESKTMHVLNKFFSLENGVWVNNRLEEEREKAISIYKKRVKAGEASAEAKRLKALEKETPDPTDDTTLDITHEPTSASTIQNTEYNTQKEENKTNKKRSRFTPPTHEEVSLYMRSEIRNSLTHKPTSIKEAEKFIDFYTSKGWMVGKNKMKDWKAAIRNWLKRVDPKDRPIDTKPTDDTKEYQCVQPDCHNKFRASLMDYTKANGQCPECRILNG